MDNRWQLGFFMALALGSAVCAPEQEVPPRPVAVVDSGDGLSDKASAWYVEPEPGLAIGVAEGDPAYQFHRVYAALRLPNGSFAVSNSGSGEIRFFDERGTFIRAAGRRGSGPGEFGEFSSMRLCSVADRLIVQDGAAARFHVFEESGEFVETVLLTGGTGRPAILGCFSDGSLLAVMGGQALEGAPGDVIQLETSYHRYAPTGEYGNPLAALQSRPRYVNEVEGRTHYPFIPLTAEPEVAADGNSFIASRGDEAAITKYDLHGNPILELRWNPGARKRTSDVWERYRRESLESMESERDLRMYTRFYGRGLPLPEFLPVMQALVVDRERNLWVERYRLPWDSARYWTVFNAEGMQLGDVELPGNLTVLDVGADYVLGRHLDDLHVERIHVYGLVKPNR